MLIKKFNDLEIFLENKKVLITSHDLVDMDGFASCFVLKFLCNEAILGFQNVSKSVESVILKLKEKFPETDFSLEKEVNVSDYDIILILDTNNLDQVKFPNNFNILNSEIPFVFIDHHLDLKNDYDGNITSLNIIEDRYSSTAEIILELCEHLNLNLTLQHKYLLGVAILTDSGFFRHGNNDTIKRVSRLLDKEVDYQEILELLQFKEDISEKTAKIKGLQRVELIREKDWLIGLTHIGSFEASVANSLIRLGFDVAIVYSEKKKEYRISTRAKKNICLKTGLHLGKILEELSELSEGSGGGHDGAASIIGKVNLKSVIDKILEKLKQILKN